MRQDNQIPTSDFWNSTGLVPYHHHQLQYHTFECKKKSSLLDNFLNFILWLKIMYWKKSNTGTFGTAMNNKYNIGQIYLFIFRYRKFLVMHNNILIANGDFLLLLPYWYHCIISIGYCMTSYYNVSRKNVVPSNIYIALRSISKNQGTLTEGESSVQLTSSLRQVVL